MSAPGAETKSRLDPEPMPRRDFLGMAAIWSAASAFFLAMIGMLRLPKAAVLSSPSKKFTVRLPDSWPSGKPWIPAGRSVAVVRDHAGICAISLICTHLGCIVKSTEKGFECPCHGSLFQPDGTVSKGPAPKALPWLKIEVRGDGYVVDEATIVAQGTKVAS